MTRIQLRHDTAANFASVNPVLLAGEVGVETDTNKMKIGDGTTAYNSLEYFGGDIDLSNYYNKTETDELLDEKQDKLSPNPPLTITEYTKSNLEGLTYTMDGTGLLSAGVTDNSKSQYVNTDTNSASQYSYYGNHTLPTADDYYNVFWNCGYIDIPYTFGQVVGGGKFVDGTTNNNYPNIFLGKMMDNKFIPILLVSGGTSIIILDDNGAYTRDTNNASIKFDNSSYYRDSNRASTYTFSGDDAYEYRRPYGTLLQLVDNTSNITIAYGKGKYFFTQVNSSNYSRLKEITTARIVPVPVKGSDTTYPLLVDGIGLWNSENQITTSTFTTENALGENLFDISGVTKQTYLDLHIGSGLAIDGSGNLVNTVDISNKVTGTGITNMVALTQAEYDALTTKDASTFYVIVAASS